MPNFKGKEKQVLQMPERKYATHILGDMPTDLQQGLIWAGGV